MGIKIFIDFLLCLPLILYTHTHLQTQTKLTSLCTKCFLAVFAVSTEPHTALRLKQHCPDAWHFKFFMLKVNHNTSRCQRSCSVFAGPDWDRPVTASMKHRDAESGESTLYLLLNPFSAHKQYFPSKVRLRLLDTFQIWNLQRVLAEISANRCKLVIAALHSDVPGWGLC